MSGESERRLAGRSPGRAPSFGVRTSPGFCAEYDIRRFFVRWYTCHIAIELLLLELQDTPEVRENSTAWGELRASAVFDPVLREDLARATLMWVQEVAALLGQVHPMAPAARLASAAERLTALLEGLSMRWLSGGLAIDHARALMSEAIEVELARLRQR